MFSRNWKTPLGRVRIIDMKYSFLGRYESLVFLEKELNGMGVEGVYIEVPSWVRECYSI